MRSYAMWSDSEMHDMEQSTKADLLAVTLFEGRGEETNQKRVPAGAGGLVPPIGPTLRAGLSGRRLYPSAVQSARARPITRMESTRMCLSKLGHHLAAHPPARSTAYWKT